MKSPGDSCKDPHVAKSTKIILELDGHEVTVSNPEKVYFPKAGITKLELVQYYLAVAEGALRGVARRPMILKRFVNGIEEEPFYQKRAPIKRPDWIDIATFTFPSGRHADEIAVSNRAQLVYVVNLGCVDLNPHAVRAEDMDRPDELRIDLDPVPGVGWPQIVEVARVAKDVLEEHGLVGWPKTSGSRGVHVWARIAPRWPFKDVRRAALAFAREVERRAPGIATAKWWKEERSGVFLDYNQNARDRTTAGAYSVRAKDDARASIDAAVVCDPAAYTLRTVPAMFAARGDVYPPGSTTRWARSRASSRSPIGRRSRGGGRAVAAALREGGGRGPARRTVARREARDRQAHAEGPGPRDREREAEGRCARRARAVEAALSRGRGAAPARRYPRRYEPGPRNRVVPGPRQPPARTAGAAPAAGAARSGLRLEDGVDRLRAQVFVPKIWVMRNGGDSSSCS